MMINKRLIGTVRESKKYIICNVILQWCGLAASIAMMASTAWLIGKLYEGEAGQTEVLLTGAVVAAVILIRFLCTTGASRMSYLSSRAVKKTLRARIYEKLLQLGTAYQQNVKTSEVVQVAVEGVEQLETYFGAYLPQFFYAMLAPLTLFLVLLFVSPLAAFILLVCVPLIPLSIAGVQTWAKKLLSKYWGQYTTLGDTFLENLQGLTTLKIYQSDGFKHEEMNRESEEFRKITMKVLTMQLNSITIMDLVAYGGAAFGMIAAVSQYKSQHVTLAGCLFIILLSADFFIPMRQLGSFFHIAMNGMAASDKIFRLLDLPEDKAKQRKAISNKGEIVCRKLSFSYEADRQVLKGVNIELPKGSFTALVGESGCGKSTLAAILTGRNKGWQGEVLVDGASLAEIREENLLEQITYIGFNSYLFKGTVRDNLLMARPDAAEEELWQVLERTRLAEFFRSERGLDMEIREGGSNLSGGQRQRLALARAMLHNSPVYIFDEAASNIDAESENDIMEQIYKLAEEKTVLLISHRLANVTGADRIYVLDGGQAVEEGSHQELLSKNGFYARLWNTQQGLEHYGKEQADG